MGAVLKVDDNRDYFSPRAGRCRPEAAEFRDRDFHGKMGGVLNVHGETLRIKLDLVRSMRHSCE